MLRTMKTTIRIFKALADETRLRILALLFEGELCVCDLVALLRLPQSTVSRHLAYLRTSGLVCDRREGVWMYYRLAGVEAQFQQELLALLARRLPDHPRIAADRAVRTQRPVAGRVSACG